MCEFLEDWLRTRLGIPVQFNEVGAQFFDGKLFFKILQSYNVVGPEVKQHFRKAVSEEEALKNLNLLRVCFKVLGVLRDDSLLDEIARKNGSACIELLNDLYLRLSNRNVLPIVNKEKEKQILNHETGRFKKSKVAETKCILPGKKRPVEELLLGLKTSVRLFGHNHLNESNEIELEMQKRLTATSEAAKEEIKRGLEQCNCGTTIEECLKKFDEKVSESQAKGDCERKQICSSDEYVKMLKLRTLKEATDKEMEMRLKDIVIKKLWCKQMKEREKEFQCSLAEKLVKQSQYEREIVQRLGMVHLQHQVIAENRRRIHEEAQRIYSERMQNIEWRLNSKPDPQMEKEKQRILELHRKIFDERVAQARREIFIMIESVVNDLVDMSIKISQFEAENVMKVPLRDLKHWKLMFYKSLPLLPKSTSINEAEMSDSDESFDYYINQSSVLEDTFNDQNLDEYLILLGPWAKELWPELENVEEDQNVLGFVVHRLLEFKYPLPEPPKPVDIPLYPVRVILDNFVDEKAMKALKNLMEKPKIEIIEIPSLINSCVLQYKKEMGIEDLGKSGKKKDRKSIVAKPVQDKKEKKGKKNEIVEPLFKSVEVQFPSLSDLEPPPPSLSKFAELGKTASEILGSGSTLPSELIISIITEFLQNLEEREGWVLVNFPLDCNQVCLMELTFTGLKAPIRCEIPSEENKEEGEILNEDEFMNSNEMLEAHEDLSIDNESETSERLFELRTSRLVPRPNPPPPKYIYKPYFTRYIHVELGKPAPDDISVMKKQEHYNEIENKNVSFTRSERDIEDNSVATQIHNDSNERQSPNSFYATTDIYLHFFYTKFDLTTLKQLGRAILNESDGQGLERKSSSELFGELARDKSKKRTSKASRKASTTKNKKEVTSESITLEDSTPEHLEVEEVVKSVESIPCQVAELCWVYTTQEIPKEFMLALASLWESTEMSYIHNLMDLFSFYREHDTCVVPYRNNVFRKLNAEMEAPDNRQDLVTEFQNELNDVVDTLRGNGEMKREFFCKIFELQLKLWDLCDTKKKLCEEERRCIINENWMPKHVCGLFNLYVSMMETELDRFIDSIQLLHNYYILSLGKPNNSSPLQKWTLPRYKLSEFENTETSTENEEKKKSEGNSAIIPNNDSLLKRCINVPLPTEGISAYFSEILTNIGIDSGTENPFLESMALLARTLHDEVTTIANIQFADIDKEKKFNLLSKSATSKQKIVNKNGKGGLVKDRLTKSDLTKSQEQFQVDDEAISLQKAVSEWTKAVQNETDRTVFRVLLLKNRFSSDLVELQDLIMETFHGLYNEISTRYFDQTKYCDSLLKVLMASVEAETKIKPSLILNLHTFSIKEGEESLGHIPPPPVSPIEEIHEEFTFSIQQLYKFTEKMVSVSPLGITVETLISMIEDMALMGHENGYPYLPISWSLMTRNEIRKVIRGVFGDIVVVDWKDLLVFGLNFRFPSVQEVIEARDKFLVYDLDRTETVSREDYNKVVLWFEKELCKDIGEDLRTVLGKKFLFDLYSVDENTMNYTALLLNYCKDENPVEGFGKALALATGTGYVLCEDKLYMLDPKQTKTQGHIVVEQIINILLANTLKWAEGIVITEVDDYGNPIREDENEFVTNDFGLTYAENLLDAPEKMRQVENNEPNLKEYSPLHQSKVNLKSILSSESQWKQKDNQERISTEDNVIWASWVPRKVVLSLLLTSLLSYALPEEEFYLQTQIEESLLNTYRENGVRDCIQAHELAQTPFIKDLFSKCYKFKSCDLRKLITSFSNTRVPSNMALP